MHSVERTKDAYLDFFSCKSFEPKDVLDCVKEYFKPKKIKQKLIYRDAP